MSDTTDTILCVIAPGESYKITPHPSGVPGLPPLELRSGDTMRVTHAEAERLYQSGRILHPETGQVRPPPAREEARASITYHASGQRVFGGQGVVVDPSPSWATLAAEDDEKRRKAAVEKSMPPAPGPHPRAAVTGSPDPTWPVEVHGADGRPWPSW